MKLFYVAAAALLVSTAAYADGDAAAGAQVFKKCSACHQVGPNAKNTVGPNLNHLNGRAAGSVEGFNYSNANKSSGLTWNEATFLEYIAAPQKKVPGTKMTFPGLSDENDRKNLWAFLISQN